MKEINNLLNDKKFKYKFDLEEGITIKINDDTTIKVDSNKIKKINELDGKSFDLKDNEKENSFKIWVNENISESEITSYLATIFIEEDYAGYEDGNIIFNMKKDNVIENEEKKDSSNTALNKKLKVIKRTIYVLILLISISLFFNIFLFNNIKKQNEDFDSLVNSNNKKIESIPKIESKIDSLNKDIQEMQSSIDLNTDITFDNLSDIVEMKMSSASLNLYEQYYSPLKSSVGTIFFIVLDNFENYGNGIKITLRIGNPYNINYNGFNFKVNSYKDTEGAKYSDDDYHYETTRNEPDTIYPGWNTFTYTLENFDTGKYETISITDFNVDSINIMGY